MKWLIGAITVTNLVELYSSSIGRYILPDATEAELDKISWLRPFRTGSGAMQMAFQSLIIETEDQTIIVDTCIGNNKARGYPRWNLLKTNFLEDLAALRFGPDRVDTVLCTHMHVDHVGWNTYLDDGHWRATFANAKYLYAKDEWAHWKETGDDDTGPVFEDSVKPIFDLGLAELVDSNHRVGHGVQLVPTPGHTPGHVSVRIESRGEIGFITGDIFHHPCQIAKPEWSATADVDQEKALETRHRCLADWVDQPYLIIGTHFAGPIAGRIVQDGNTYRLDY